MVILSAIDLTKKVRNEINKLAGEAQVEIAIENNVIIYLFDVILSISS